MINNILLVLLTALLFINSAHAENKNAEPGDIIKYRQSAMMYMRWNMGVIKKQVVKQPDSFNREEVVAAAKVISAIAASNMDKLFPANTKKGKGWKPTRVKSDYFNNPDDVKEKSRKLVDESQKLLTLAENNSPDMIRAQLKNVLSSCKSCHKAYRSK